MQNKTCGERLKSLWKSKTCYEMVSSIAEISDKRGEVKEM